MKALRARLFDVLESADERSAAGGFVDGFLATLIVANVVAVVLETMVGIGDRHAALFAAFEVISVAIFTVEYALRLWVAPERGDRRFAGAWRARLRYSVTPLALIDLIAILPFYLGALVGMDLRILRLLRLLRIFKLTRYSPALGSMAAVLHNERRAIVGALFILAILLVMSSALMYVLERDVQPEAFGSIPSAMWWAVSTLTTVGYGDVLPATPAGRVVGTLVMILGIGVFVLWTSIFAAGFIEETRKRSFVVTWKLVARVPLFSRLDAERIAEIAQLLTMETVPPRFTVIRRGEPADSMYFIASGDVEADWPHQVIHLGPGHFFGELGVLEETACQATVTTLSECQLLRLDRADFLALLDSEPPLKEAILQIVAERHKGRPNANNPPAG